MMTTGKTLNGDRQMRFDEVAGSSPATPRRAPLLHGGIAAAAWLAAAAAVADAKGAATLVDFTEPGIAYRVTTGAYRADAPERQVEISGDGLTVSMDRTKQVRASKWMTLDVPAAVGGRTDWTGRRFTLVMPQPPSGFARSDIALNFTDADGETFQFMRHGESFNDNGEFCLDFDLTTKRPKGWGGRRQNGEFDGPLRLSAINVHYLHDDKITRGEVVFVRIDDAGTQLADVRDRPRDCRTREAVSVDTMYPGAAPFPGAEELSFTVEPAFDGKAKLVLSYGSTGSAVQGILTNFLAVATNGVVRAPVHLPYDVRYEFMKLDCRPAAGSPKGPFTVTRAQGVFMQTAAEAMRLRVETGNDLHLTRDETERPVLVVSNPAEKAIAWRTEFVLEDMFGRTVRIPFAQTVPAGGEVRVDVPWPLPAKGIWHVRAQVAAEDGSVAAKETRFAYIDRHEVTPLVEKPKFRMGIHYHGTHYWPGRVDRTIAALVAAGAKFTRTDYSFMWSAVERKPGEYDWEKADVMLRKMRAAGLSLDIIFAGSPGWAIEQEYKDKAGGWKKAGLRVRMGLAPTRPGLFRDFCEKFARRYGTQIDYYETGNEWDLSGTGTFPHDALLRMQREAYEGIHAGCPDACVIPNGWTTSTTPDNADHKNWNQGLVEAFAQHPEWYDAWALHCHGDFGGFRAKIVDQFLPLRARTPLKARPWLLNETALTSANGREHEVAATVWKKILFGWGHGARDYIWYNLRATGWFNGGEPGYGLITADFHPRAGYAAFAALSAIFQGLDADGIVHSSATAHLFRFRGESKGLKGIALAGWTGRDFSAFVGVRIRTDATRVEVSDIMGNRLPVEKDDDGVVTFHVGHLPQALLLHGATTAEALDPEVLARERMDAVRVHRDAANMPHVVLAGVRYVHDNYEANPAMVHRLWKGDRDNSARVWFTPTAEGVKVKVVVRDDVSAAGDRVELDVVDAAGAKRSLTLKPVRRMGNLDVYEAVLPVGDAFGFDMKVHDDDGEGEDSYLFLREPGAGSLLIHIVR